MRIFTAVGLAGFMMFSSTALAQTKAPEIFLRPYMAALRLELKRSNESGVLFELTDSTIILAPIRGLKPKLNALVAQHGGVLPPTDSLTTNLLLRTYRYSEVRRLTLRRRGNAVKGFFVGAVLGVSIGLISGDDPPGFIAFSAADKAFISSIFFAPAGLLIGAAIHKSVNAKTQSIAVEVPARFRKFTIVEQVRQATLYKP